MDLPTTVKVHFSVGPRQEIALFRSNTPLEEIKDLFRSAAEAGQRDILKLYDSEGHLLNICASLASNTAQTCYTLDVVAVDGVAMLEDSLGAQFRKIEARIARIERQLKTELPLPQAVEDLQRQVDAFRLKLETSESLSWLGFYKQLPEPLSSEECKRLQYRRKSDSVKKRVKENFANICDSAVSDNIKEWLRQPTFDATPWDDEELLLLLQTMYLEYDLCSKFAIDVEVLRNFLYEAYKNYNDVPFHNFRHCFCVTQMMYAITKSVDLSSKIGDLEILILLTSCICHDLDHPGYNNIYQINAKTELAIRYNDISPLENHHCSVAFRIFENEDCNIFKSFSMEEFKQIREGIIRCILATDMARHNEILTNFREIISIFDASDKSHVNLLCMVLIKVSDISNEARPMDVAEPWLDKLLQEFFKQSDAEKLEGLPVTPFMDREKITKPSSQCSFIGLVLLPLFEALSDLFPALQDFIVQPVRDALDYYKRLNEATREERLQRKSIVAELAEQQKDSFTLSPDSAGQNNSGAMSKSASNNSVKIIKKSLSFQQNRSRSRSTEDDTEVSMSSVNALNEAPSLEDVAEDPESGDSNGETATEVEVSEKTLKFKISTEGSIGTGRKSYPGSRKGSKERVQNFNSTDLARMVQRGRLRAGALSFDQHCLAATKKLSCDPPEFLDEYALTLKKKFEETLQEYQNNNSEDDEKCDSSTNECIVSKETLNLNKRNSEHYVKVSVETKDSEKYTNAEKLKMNNVSHKNKNEDAPKESEKICDINVLKDEEKQQLAVNEAKSSRSFFSRLKQFTDRFSLSMDKHKSSKNEIVKNNNCSKTASAKCKKKELQKICCKSLEEVRENMKASTLPKFKKSGYYKKGWKFLGSHKEKRLEGWSSDADVDKLKTRSFDHLENESLPSSSQLSKCSSPKKTPDNLRSPKRKFLDTNYLESKDCKADSLVYRCNKIELNKQPFVITTSEKDPAFI